MKNFLHSFLLILVFAVFLHAQSESPKCPSISVEGPSSPSRPGDEMPFRVTVSKEFNSANLKYVWSVSNANILSGQGTTSIIAKHSDLVSATPTATVEVKGLPEGCPNTVSETTIPFCGVESFKVDDYGKVSSKDENLRLNAFAQAFQNDPNSTGFIIRSFPRRTSKLAAYQNLNKILEYLTRQNIPEGKIIFGFKYDNQERTELIIIPLGAVRLEVDGEVLDATQLAGKLKNSKMKSQKNLPRKN